MDIGGNTVLITGGATGIGFALAEKFSSTGSEVIICGRRESKLQSAKRKLPTLHIRRCDVSAESDRRALLRWCSTHFSSLNVLVNNAGMSVAGLRSTGKSKPRTLNMGSKGIKLRHEEYSRDMRAELPALRWFLERLSVTCA